MKLFNQGHLKEAERAGVDAAQVIAAIDLGSNSFHMKVARVVDGQLAVIDRMREPVRLAAGLNEHNKLRAKAFRQRPSGGHQYPAPGTKW